MDVQPHIELLDAAAVRRILKCSLSWVYAAAETGVLPAVRIQCQGKGRPKAMVRFKLEDIYGFIEKNYHRGA
jgi:hypothetical protein